MYKCDHCEYTSNKINNVNLHSDIKHRGSKLKLKTESFNCDKCLKVFSRKFNLQRHYENCKGIVNPCECQKCNKIFSCMSSRIRHSKTCKVKETNITPSVINNITNITNNTTNNNTNITNNIINNTYIFQSDPNVHPLAYQNYSMIHLSNDVILPNKNNFPLMIEDFGRLIYNDERNKNIKKKGSKTKYCLVKKENGEWINKLDKDIIPKVTKDIAYNFRIVIDDNETELVNINRRLKSIIPELTEFLGILIDFNFDLEELNDTDREDSKKFKDMKNRTICIIVDSSKA
jgi:hypothetical protein